MGLFGKSKSKSAKNKSKSAQGAQNQEPLNEEFHDTLVDPLMGKTAMSKKLKRRGGKGKEGQAYKAILAQLKLIEDPSVPMLKRLRYGKEAIRSIDTWLDNHQGDKSPRAKGIRKARKGVQAFKQAAYAQGGGQLQDYFDGGEASIGAVSQAGAVKQSLGANKELLTDQWRAVKGDNPELGERILAGMQSLQTVQGDWRQHREKLEADHLTEQISSEGITGGQATRTLGAGAVGEAFLADFGGDQMVFKEDGDLPEAMQGAGANVGLSSSRAVASSAVNDALGSSVIGKTSFAEMDGKHGTAMPLAQGQATRRVGRVNWEGHEDLEDTASFAEAGRTEKVFFSEGNLDYSDPVLQRDLVELQVNDIITAQIDRHGGNYHVDKDEEGNVTGVNAFDNDGAFGTEMLDWNEDVYRTNRQGAEIFPNAMEMPPVLSEEQAARIQNIDIVALSSRLHELLPTDEVQGALWRIIELQNHVLELRSVGRIIPEYGPESYEMLMNAGGRASYVARESLAQTQMDALQDSLAGAITFD